MRLFQGLYDVVMRWSRGKYAPQFLGAVSFAESSFFPIPPDVMLISMGLAKPQSVWWYALITSFFSVLGGILGYILGYGGMEFILPLIKNMGQFEHYQQVQQYFNHYGVWIVFIAGFTPIPYKLFTLAAGAMQMAILPFILASIFSRSLRFFLVASLLYFKGEVIEAKLSKHIEWIGWSTLLLLILIWGVLKLWG